MTADEINSGSTIPRPMDKKVPTAIRKIALVASGTAGHVRPALAVAEAYRNHLGDPEILFLGAQDGFKFEDDLVAKSGYRLELIGGAPFYGVGPLGKVRALFSVLTGMRQARRIFKDQGTDLVIGFGGYGTPGALLAAKRLGLHTAIHEANAIPGRANRFLARFVDRIFLAMPEAETGFPPARTSVVGLPLRPEMAMLKNLARDLNSPARVLVTGGSLGSTFLNQQAPLLIAAAKARGLACEVLHQAGPEGAAEVGEAYTQAGIDARVVPFIEDMATAYRWANLAVSACGAGALTELAFAGLPSLLVPVASVSDDHQTGNGKAFAAVTGALMVEERNWSVEESANYMTGTLSDASKYRLAVQGMRQGMHGDAASSMVKYCEAAFPFSPERL